MDQNRDKSKDEKKTRPSIPPEPRRGFNLAFVLIAVFGVLILHDILVGVTATQRISYSEFMELVEEGKVEEVAVGTDRITGRLKGEDGKPGAAFTTVRVDEEIAAKLSSRGVSFEGTIQNTFLRDILSWILPAAFFIGIWLFILRRLFTRGGGIGGNLMSVGKSKAKIYIEEDLKVTFEDVAGVDEAKEELEEVVNFLKQPGSYGRLGGRLPKGILLVGPPGTGKTLLARAVAGEAGVPFLSISGSEFVEMFVGVGAARVRDLFQQARGKAPCIIFIDELDAMGRARGIGPFSGGHDEKEQTLNQLLVEMDGFDPTEGVILMGATNRPEILDPALLRAGRFDRQILVDRPDKKGREQILRVHMKKIRVSSDLDPETVAALTPGFSGADLANLVNEAALLATRAGKKEVELADFTAGVERIVAGLEKKNRVLNAKERRIVAYHEMGHAIVATEIPGCDPVHKISIIPRGIGALGYTMQRPTEDRYLMTRQELLDKMAVLLGGRAAEQLIFNEISTGAADDLDRATDIARSMVTRYGMAARLGLATYDRERNPQWGDLGPSRQHFGDATATEIDEEVRTLLEQAFERALAILSAKRRILEQIAKLLLERETIHGDELTRLLTEEPVEVAG